MTIGFVCVFSVICLQEGGATGVAHWPTIKTREKNDDEDEDNGDGDPHDRAERRRAADQPMVSVHAHFSQQSGK